MKTTRITTRKKNALLTPLVNSITTRLKKGNSPKNNRKITRSTRTIIISLVEDDSKKNEVEVEASRDA